jgi:hypothetical protein
MFRLCSRAAAAAEEAVPGQWRAPTAVWGRAQGRARGAGGRGGRGG